MQAKLSPISRLFYLIIIAAVIYFLVQLAYGWSLDETMRFSRAVVGDQYARAASWTIQLLPQALLVMTAFITVKNKKYSGFLKSVVFIALAVNMVDALTNIGAYMIWVELPEVAAYKQTMQPMVQEMAYWFGFILAFGVTWAEEAIMLLVALGLNLMVETARDFDKKVPAWFRLDDYTTIARHASGVTTAQEMLDGDSPSPPASRPTRRSPVPRGNTLL